MKIATMTKKEYRVRMGGSNIMEIWQTAREAQMTAAYEVQQGEPYADADATKGNHYHYWVERGKTKRELRSGNVL